MKIKVVVAEKNDDIRDEIIRILKFYSMFEIIGSFASAEETIEYVQKNAVDAVFSNAEFNPMTGGDGTYLAASLKYNYPEIMIVLYCRDKSYAYAAFQCGCAEYFCLPPSGDEMRRVFNRVIYIYDLLQYKRNSLDRSIMIKTSIGYQLLKINNILFVERYDRKNRIVCVDGKEVLLLGYSMNKLEEMLKEYNFYRCYQSFIVNLAMISFIKVNSESRSYSIMFEGYNGEVLLSRNKYSEIMELLKNKYIKLIM
ncbi:LytR/AlgR family response regulator transcription factor [Clostridium hydrogenum]|uniref:LytR/AlgR family response regulator transcription factor n=1 Tax=Clostridium hydrogenum TaxID=2855764 RepID=UPI001F1E033E|nr:LytTR family DNA-binding domain-containing protein [Clostridium hydrogenum]